MENKNMHQTTNDTQGNLMTPLEVLFGTVMAAASIYATWCTVSLLILVIS